MGDVKENVRWGSLACASGEIGELAKALAKAQLSFRHAKRDEKNPFYGSKYADLAAVMDACRQPLCENGLTVSQSTGVMDGETYLFTHLLHSSGQFITGVYPIKPMREKKGEGFIASSDPQSIGSAITYARRYALAAIVGVATEDDDAEAATGRGQTAQAAPISPGTGSSKPTEPSTGGKAPGKASAPSPYSADDEDSMRGRLVDLAAVWAHHKGITVPDAVKDFSIFHSKDRKTRQLAYHANGSPLWAFKTDPKDLTGKWLHIALEKAKELTKDLVDREADGIGPDDLPEG